jgi:hypothetical protein
MRRAACWVPVLLLSFVEPLHGQGALEHIRQDVSHGTSGGDSKGGGDSGKNSGGSEDDPWGELLGEILGPGILLAAASPFLIPHAILEGDADVDGRFPLYPYANSYPGYLWLGRAPKTAADGEFPPPLKTSLGDWWSAHLSAEYGTDFDRIQRVGGRLMLDTTSRFGLLTQWNWYHESLDQGHSDDTTIGDINLTYRFAQSERIQMHAGVGGRIMTDSHLTRGGFNFHYGADLFPAEPVVVSTSLDLGNLGDAFVVHGRATVGVTRKHWELFGGYDFLRVGSTNLQGPTAGLRIWF